MQQTVNIFPANGSVGQWATDRLKSAFGYIVRGTGATDAVAATGTITITSGQNAAANDTITVGATVYTFVSSDAVGTQINVGTDASESAANAAAVLNASGLVSASASSNVITITSNVAGTVGNAIALGATGTYLTPSGAALSGGADYVAGNNAKIGCAFTKVSGYENVAIMGGTGVYAGIFVNPYNVALYGGLAPSLTVPDGVQGEIATSGYVWLALANSSSDGDSVFFTNATGVLSAGVASTGQTQIEAKVINGGAANTPVLVALGAAAQ